MVAVAEGEGSGWRGRVRPSGWRRTCARWRGQLSAATCRWLLLIGELDRRKAYEQWGCASMAQWLSWKCGLGDGRGPSTRPGRPSSDAAAGHLRPVRSRCVVVFQSAGADPHRDACDRGEAGRVRRGRHRGAARSAPSAPTNGSRSTGTPPPRRSRRVQRDGPSRRRRHGHHRRSPPADAAETVLSVLTQAANEAGLSRRRFRGDRRRADVLEHVARCYLAGNVARPPTETVVHVDAEQLNDSGPITSGRTSHLRYRPSARPARGRRHQTGRSPHPDRPRRAAPHHRGLVTTAAGSPAAPTGHTTTCITSCRSPAEDPPTSTTA